jgi:hypothetical protein
MQTLISIALLIVTLAVAFINPYYIGRFAYIGLLGLLFLLGALLWLSFIWVSKRAAGSVVLHSRFGRLTLPSKDRVWGRLVITDQELSFYRRAGRTVEQLWSLSRSEVDEFIEKTPRTIAVGEVLFSCIRIQTLARYLRRSN